MRDPLARRHMTRGRQTALALVLTGIAAPGASAAECTKADFEAVVDGAGSALRDLNQKNKPSYQEKLRALKTKRGWSYEQFLTEAAPLVRDPAIEEFDKTSDALVTTISQSGQEGGDAATPDCALLADLRGRLTTLVETQTRKWQYMFGKVDTELGK